MKAHNIILSVVLSVLCFTSCRDNGTFWGKTNYYDNFLFVKYEPIRMEQTLLFDFNEDAQQLFNGNINFEVVEKNENSDFQIAQNIKLYKNNKVCNGNILSINKIDKQVTVGIEFTDNATDGSHTLFLREKGKSGIDRIDYQVLGTGLCVTKNKDMNPLLLGLMWFAIIVLATCIVWIIFLKSLLYESFKVKQLTITTDCFKSKNIKGCRQVVCTNKKQNQSFINQLFTGKIVFVQDVFFTADLMITPRDKKTVRVKTPLGFETTSTSVSKGETMTIKNATVTPSTTATIQIY